MRRALVLILALSTVLGASAVSAAPPAPGENAGATVLVKFRPTLPPQARDAALAEVGGRPIGSLDFIGVDVVEVPGAPAAAAASLAARPGVLYAETNALLHALGSTPNDASFTNQWALDQSNDADIDAPEGWAAAYGTDASGSTLFPTTLGGPVIGIVDTGIDTDHPDLAGKLSACASALSGLGAVTQGLCEDDNGHGTHVAGIASAVTNNDRGIAGVAPDARIAMCKALNSAGAGFLSDVNACMNWLVSSAGASVISLSLGGGKSSSQQDTVTKIWNGGNGTLMVAAAGNDGDRTVTYPAGYAEVVSVASTTKTDSRSSFSNVNDDVEVAAPGSSIYSTYVGGLYATLSGTSMATPHAGGVAAMIELLNSGFNGQQLRDALTAAVDDLGPAGRDPEFGYGRVNLAKAVSGGEESPPPPAEDGQVAGTVLNRKTPLAGATVSWTGPETGSTTTGGDGSYLAAGLTPGSYRFTASATGCRSRSASVTVTAGATTLQDFRLRC